MVIRVESEYAPRSMCHCWLVQQCRRHGWASQPCAPRATVHGLQDSRCGKSPFPPIFHREFGRPVPF